jgi:hypothetical protein
MLDVRPVITSALAEMVLLYQLFRWLDHPRPLRVVLFAGVQLPSRAQGKSIPSDRFHGRDRRSRLQ